MRDLYDKLIKILRLEQSKNFNDSAVIGGLEGFLTFWLAEARAKTGDAAARRKVEEVGNRLQGYAKMETEQRRSQALYLIERLSVAADQVASATPTPFPGTIQPESVSPTDAPDAAEEATTPPPVMSSVPPPRPTAPRPPESSRPPRAEREPRHDTPHPPRKPQEPQPRRAKGASPRRSWSPDEALRLEHDLDRPVTGLPGIGAAKTDKLKRLGIQSVRDLLFHAPFRYEDYTSLKTIAELMYGDEVTFAAVVQDIDVHKSQRGAIVVTARVGDGTGTVDAKWFGNRFLLNQLPPGTMVRMSGKIDQYMGRLQVRSPRFEIIEEAEVRSGRLVPIYPRTEGVTEKALMRDIATALDHYAGKIPDPLPPDLRERFGLVDLSQALYWLHQAATVEQAQAARQRLAFDELLRLQLGMLQQRRVWQSEPGHRMESDPALRTRFYAALPFELTAAQRRVIDEILGDMAQPWAMSRLLQGDVGSGKTAVAAVALLVAVAAGYQGALMAPTEILAEQHFQGLSRFLNPEGTLLLDERPLRVALLTGSMSASSKQAAREAIAAGEVDVVVGTHALIQQEVEFANLGLAVVDEQHRFGVKQRGALRSRAPTGAPDVLVMSATPIPRTLALTLYGDLDLSVIDEMPPGRQPIVTRAITPHQRERAYTYIRRQLLEGRQAFVICPLVEESEKLEARAAVDEHRFLQEEVFPDFTVELLHGRLRPEEKEAAMGRFYRNESQLLVSTSVVEVGIDVPNATVMLIEGANRFGLAQLHQFRGRVGRGPWRSLCLLMAEETLSSDGEQRLNALVENNDGFALAEEDLKMRGPGDYFGTRQSGLPELRLARLSDTPTLTLAREAAQLILEQDPELAHPDHTLLKEQTRRTWQRRGGELS